MPFLSPVQSGLTRIREDLFELFFPRACLICQSSCDRDPFCDACLNCLRLLPAPVCPRCRFFIRAPDLRCPQGHIEMPSPVWAPAIYDVYHRSLIHHFKFRARKDCGRYAAGQLADMLASDVRIEEVDAVVSVPLHAARKRERGFDQSELVAEVIAKRLDRNLGRGWLRRIRYTPSQTRFGPEQRLANVDAAFETRVRGPVPGTVLLVDDVLTTGATLRACARALQLAGVRRILAAVLALAEYGDDGPDTGPSGAV